MNSEVQELGSIFIIFYLLKEFFHRNNFLCDWKKYFVCDTKMKISIYKKMWLDELGCNICNRISSEPQKIYVKRKKIQVS